MAITIAQSGSGGPGGGGGSTSITLALTNNPANGALLVISIGSSANSLITNIAGGGITGSWNQEITKSNTGGAEVWTAYATGTVKSWTITISSKTTSSTTFASIYELAGMATSSPVEGTNFSTTSSATISSGTYNNTASDNINIVAIGTPGTYSSGPTNGFTEHSTATTRGRGANLYKIQTASGNAETSYTDTGAVSYAGVIVAIKAASTGVYTANVSDTATTSENSTIFIPELKIKCFRYSNNRRNSDQTKHLPAQCN
jgi:hypothetical protein